MNKGLRTMPVLAVLSLFLLFAAPGQAAEKPSSSTTSRLLFNGELIATEISKVTGCAISPILGISVLGAYTYYTTPASERGRLPWHAAPQFWVPLLVILLGIILKDSAKVALPKIIMTPLDAAETLLEKNTSAVLALIVLLTSITGKGLDQLRLTASSFTPSIPASAHAAAETAQQAGPNLAGVLELGALILILTVMYAVVWIVSQSFNILIFLCPFSSLDLLLTLGKNSVLALLLGAFLLHPFAGLLVALAIVLVSFFFFAWSFRFMLFGTLIALDLLRGPARTLPADAREVRAFSCRYLKEVPAMSYGLLRRQGETLVFTYRPWLILRPHTVSLPEGCAAYSLSRSTLSALLVRGQKTGGGHTAVCRLRPCYNSYEQGIAEMLGLKGVRDARQDKPAQKEASWLREQIAG
ncbi:MAG TPA: hypothetical protein DDY20_07320 [Desulfobulbaceae bacterium]|nr:hypothetical protein [Desulfobulbaceae bacterium]